MKEALVKARIKKALAAYPDAWWFMPPGMGLGRAGIPDFIGCYDGVLFGIEAKGEGGKTTALQEREMQRIRDAGGFAIVIDHTRDISLAVCDLIVSCHARAKQGAKK